MYSKTVLLPYFLGRKEANTSFILRLNIIKVKKNDAWSNVDTSDDGQCYLSNITHFYKQIIWRLCHYYLGL